MTRTPALFLRLLLAGSVFAAVFLTFGELPHSVAVNDQFEPKLDQARSDEGELVEHNCRAHGKHVTPRVCVYGDPGSGKRVVLFGDSHALQWGPALIPIAKKRGWKLITVVRAGCPIADVVTEPDCAEWRRQALDRIERDRPRHIIISTSIGGRYRLKYGGLDLSRRESESRLQAGMVRTIERLKKIPSLVTDESAITLIRDQVMAPFVPADCLRENRGKVERCLFPNERKFGPGFDWVAAQRTGITPTIDPTKVLCDRKWCSPTQGKILKYRDTDHITATYARTLSEWFDDRLGIE